jgi:hypothetical protein
MMVLDFIFIFAAEQQFFICANAKKGDRKGRLSQHSLQTRQNQISRD